MFDASAEHYDLIYATFKDYETEAEQIARLLHGLKAAAPTNEGVRGRFEDSSGHPVPAAALGPLKRLRLRRPIPLIPAR